MTETDPKRFPGNDVVSAEAQEAYFKIREEMRLFPPIAKRLVITPSDSGWLEIIAILEFLQLKKIEGSQ